jgi:hypothetical protein
LFSAAARVVVAAEKSLGFAQNVFRLGARRA